MPEPKPSDSDGKERKEAPKFDPVELGRRLRVPIIVRKMEGCENIADLLYEVRDTIRGIFRLSNVEHAFLGSVIAMLAQEEPIPFRDAKERINQIQSQYFGEKARKFLFSFLKIQE